MTEVKKIKRNHRMLFISQYLVENPNKLVSLTYFVDYFNCAKSSISEDVDFLREVFEYNGIGEIHTVTGVAGGIIFRPNMKTEEVDELFSLLQNTLKTGKRILPGNYVYVGDLLQEPETLNRIAKLMAMRYQGQNIDAIMTIETKGIGLAVAVARYLNVPYVVVRRERNDAEGSTVSVRYVSGSLQKVKKMELSKLSLKPNSNVLIVDDFLRNGGTINGLMAMTEEFDCRVAGVCVLAQNIDQEKQALPAECVSLLDVQIVYNADAGTYQLSIEKGNFFNK